MVQVVVAVAGVPQFRKRREGRRKAEKDMAAKIRTLSVGRSAHPAAAAAPGNFSGSPKR